MSDTKERPLFRYLLFTYQDTLRNGGGWHDFVGSYGTLAEAQAAFNDGDHWIAGRSTSTQAQIVDATTSQVCARGWITERTEMVSGWKSVT